MPNPHYVTETQTTRQVASDPNCRIKFTRHAEVRMRERNITAPDVIHVLTTGQVTLAEYKQDVVWRVEGVDLDGTRLSVEAVVMSDEIKIKVVTAF